MGGVPRCEGPVPSVAAPSVGSARQVRPRRGGGVMRRSRILLAAVAAVGLVSGGTAAAAGLAATPVDGSGVIHGCWTTKAVNGGSHTFVLRNAGTACPAGTTAITWNKAGPAGPQGPQGIQGVQGPQGPAGVVEGASGTSSTAVPLTAVQNLAVVMSASAVPASGDYYVDAVVMLRVGAGDTVACILAKNGNALGAYSTVGGIGTTSKTYETLPLRGKISMAAGDVPGVMCTGYSGSQDTEFYDGSMTAMLMSGATGNALVQRPGSRALPPRF